MRVLNRWIYGCATAASVALIIGCGGSGGGSSTNGTNGNNGSSGSITQAQTDLSTAFKQPSLTSASFQQAVNDFGGISGVTGCPATYTDPRAISGYVIASLMQEALLEYTNVTGSASFTPSALPKTGVFGGIVLTKMAPFPDFRSLPSPLSIVQSMLPTTLAQPANLGGNFHFQLSDLPVWDNDLIALDTFIKNLLKCQLANVNFASMDTTPLVITVPTGNGTTATEKIGAAEMYALRASLYLLAAGLDGLTMYSYNTGTFSLSTTVNSVVSSHVNNGAFSLGGTLLPGGSFLTRVTNNGPEQLTFLKDAFNDVDSGLTDLENRTPNGFLFDLLNQSHTQIASIKGQIDPFKSYLTSTQTFNATINHKPEAVQVDLPAFFANPPTDLKALLPTVTFDGTFVHNDILPDPTFGGLFPNGVAVYADAYGGQPFGGKYNGRAVTSTITFQQWYGIQ